MISGIRTTGGNDGNHLVFVDKKIYKTECYEKLNYSINAITAKECRLFNLILQNLK